MGQSTVKSAERTLEVLSFLSAQPGPVLASAISRTVGLPKSSTYHLLNVMRDHGYVTYFPDERAWALGATARDIGTGQGKRGALERLARPLMRELAGSMQESVLLSVDHGPEALIILRRDPGAAPMPGVPEVGSRLPAHLSAFGRAQLMLEPVQRIQWMFPASNELPTIIGRGPRRQAELVELLDGSRARGFATDHGEIQRSSASVAAPVLDHLGLVVAALGVTYWAPSRDGAGIGTLSAAILRAAMSLSERLGYGRGGQAQAC